MIQNQDIQDNDSRDQDQDKDFFYPHHRHQDTLNSDIRVIGEYISLHWFVINIMCP